MIMKINPIDAEVDENSLNYISIHVSYTINWKCSIIYFMIEFKIQVRIWNVRRYSSSLITRDSILIPLFFSQIQFAGWKKN